MSVTTLAARTIPVSPSLPAGFARAAIAERSAPAARQHTKGQRTPATKVARWPSTKGV